MCSCSSSSRLINSWFCLLYGLLRRRLGSVIILQQGQDFGCQRIRPCEIAARVNRFQFPDIAGPCVVLHLAPRCIGDMTYRGVLPGVDFFSRCSVRAGRSCRRSRNGGRSMCTTLSR